MELKPGEPGCRAYFSTLCRTPGEACGLPDTDAQELLFFGPLLARYSAAVELMGRADEIAEQRMRLERFRLEFRVELAA